MNPSTIAVAEASSDRYYYSQEIAPNDYIWLALGLPVQPVGSTTEQHLHLKIADTMVFGFGRSGIYLKTDIYGNIARRESSLSDYLAISSRMDGIVAYEKEAFMKLVPARDDMPSDVYTFEGNYSTALREKQFQSLISQTYQRMEHEQRRFRIQYHVQIRHRKVYKYAYNRVIYKQHDKSYVLAIRSMEGPLEQEKAPTSREKPWLQRTTSDLARMRVQKPTYESIVRKHRIVDKQESNTDVLLLPEDPTLVEGRPAKSEPKRSLKTFSPGRVVVREVALSAAGDLMQLTKNVATHLSLVFRKQVSCLTLDFVKDTRGNFVLIDICGFEFSDYEKGSKRVMRLCQRVKSQMESFYRFRFDEKDAEEELEGGSGGSQSVADRSPETAEHGSDIRTPQTVLCRMCRCRINNMDTRYCMTSVMIQSTVMHMRARLQPTEWPEFCKDRGYTMKSMQRTDDQLSSKSLPRVDATEVNMYVCELCYNLYRQETRMIEVEHKLALFTRSHHDPARAKVSKQETEPSSPLRLAGPPQPPPTRRTSMNSWANTSATPLVTPTTALSSAAPSRPQTPKSRAATSTKSPTCPALGSTAESPATSAVKESAIRDLFRAKNAPSRLPSGDYFKIHFSNEKSPLKAADVAADPPAASDSPIKEKEKSKTRKQDFRPTYPQAAVMPVGRRVARSDMMTLDLTLCRMMVAVQKVSDLPVPFFDVYQDFYLTYFLLGIRTDVPCKKSMSFSRNRMNRFVNPDVHRAVAVDAIVEGQEDSDDSHSNSDSDASSQSSSNGSSVCSSSAEASSMQSSDSGTDGAGDYVMTRRASRMVMQAEGAASREAGGGGGGRQYSAGGFGGSDLCVGALDAKFMKMSHFMVHGNAMVDGLQSYNSFINETNRIMVVLCGKIKENAVVDERHWVLPDMANTKAAKAAKLRKGLNDLKAELLQKSQKGHYSHLSHLSRGHRRTNYVAGLEYNPRLDTHKLTDTGDPLPDEAIAYCYLPLSQFKSNAVKRLDLGAPMTYAIRHLPRERSVPMLRSMVGIERAVYPMDNWSLPFSMVHLEKEGGVYVPEIPDQYCSSAPLPKEWLNIELERSAHRRLGMGPGAQATDESMVAKLAMMAQSQIAVDVDGGRRAVPSLHVSAGRLERITMGVLHSSVKVEAKVDSEQKLERMDYSVWCLGIEVMQARHVCSSDEIFGEEPFWKCSYDFFGDKVSVMGHLNHSDIEEGVVTFGLLSKHMFRGSVDALEAMFADMDPVNIVIQRAEPPQEFLAAQSLSNRISSKTMSTEVHHSARVKTLVGTQGKRFNGPLSLVDVHQNRFGEVTVQLSRDDSNGDSSRRDKMYPPYVTVSTKLFRMGPREEGNWLPQQTVLGEEIYRYVNKVTLVENTQKHQDGLEETTR